MTIIAVDDETLALDGLMAAISEAAPDAKVHGFRRGGEALDFGQCVQCDVAFLDIELKDMDGISLAKQLKAVNPQLNIVFVTGYPQFTGEAMSLRASGYILKPATAEKIVDELENLRHPVVRNREHHIFVQCFGNFEVFADGEPVKFAYSKTKELLAFLVDRRGVFCSNAEIIAVLWEDAEGGERRNSYLRDLRADLMSTFAALGAEEAIYRQRGVMAIAMDKIECDYYNWVQGDIDAINAYRGEYMSQYSWGEFTLGGLSPLGTTAALSAK